MITAALREALRVFDAEALDAPSGGRLGAALCLVRDLDGDDAEIVYTRRRDDMRSHPGQISFPGGRVDPGEGIVEAALREAREEVGLDPASVTVLGRVPPFYIPPSRFWLQVVCARWDVPHALAAEEAEVAEILRVRLSTLRDPANVRAVQLSIRGWSWAWELGAVTPLWGATAMVTAVVLGLLDPGWAGGQEPSDLAASQQLEPWREGIGRGAEVPRPGPARLRDLPSRPVTGVVAEGSTRAPPVGQIPTDVVDRAGRAVALAVRRLRPGSARSDDEVDAAVGGSPGVVVLIGPGRTGAVASAAADVLEERGPVLRLAAHLDAGELEDGLRSADVVVDGLVGRGLDGPLGGILLRAAQALREVTPVVVAIDVPSGLDPEQGLIGDLVTADVTVAVGDVAPGLLAPGMGPFVGDLFLAALTADGPELARIVAEDEGEGAGTWRE